MREEKGGHKKGTHFFYVRVSVFFFDRERWMVEKKGKKKKVEKGTEAERRPEKNDLPVGKGWKLSEVPAHRLSTRRKHIQLVLVITCSLSLPSPNTILGHACHRSPVFLYNRHTHILTHTQFAPSSSMSQRPQHPIRRQ